MTSHRSQHLSFPEKMILVFELNRKNMFERNRTHFGGSAIDEGSEVSDGFDTMFRISKEER